MMITITDNFCKVIRDSQKQRNLNVVKDRKQLSSWLYYLSFALFRLFNYLALKEEKHLETYKDVSQLVFPFVDGEKHFFGKKTSLFRSHN